MAFSRSWDESSPPGSLPADQIDTAIQDTKIALRERLEQAIPGFGDDGIDPKRVRAVHYGEVDDRPTVTHGGVIYVATDEDKIYFTRSGGVWEEWPEPTFEGTTMKQGTIEDRPNPPDSDFYWATDEERLYLKVGSGWKVVASSVEEDLPLISLEHMRVYTIGGVNRVSGIDPADTVLLEPLILPGTGSGQRSRTLVVPNPQDFIPIGAKARVKRDSEIDFLSTWSWSGIFHEVNGAGSCAIAVQAIRHTNDGFQVSYQIRNSGASADFDVELYLYLLAIDSDVVIP